jgi:beta-lactamase class A
MIKIIEKLGLHVGVYAENLSTGKNYRYNDRDIFPAASVIKLPILYNLFQGYIKGKFRPTDPLSYHKSDYVEDSPWFENKAEGSYLLSDIAESMITVSDNISTNLLIDLLGMRSINEAIAEIGMQHTALNRKMCDFDARVKGVENLTTPEDTAIFFKKLIRDFKRLFSSRELKNFRDTGDYTPAAAAIGIVGILTRQQDLEKIPSGISGPDILVGNKPGELPGIMNDAALVITPDNNYIIAIFAERVFDETQANGLIAELSGQLFNYLK